jgi:hypothetical protein
MVSRVKGRLMEWRDESNDGRVDGTRFIVIDCMMLVHSDGVGGLEFIC